MSKNLEHCVCIKFFNNLGKTATKIYPMLLAYEDETCSVLAFWNGLSRIKKLEHLFKMMNVKDGLQQVLGLGINLVNLS